MTTRERSTQVRIRRRTAAYWRGLAAAHGYYQSRGTGAGVEGNIAALMEAVERGEVEVRSVVRSEAPDSAVNVPEVRGSAEE